VDYAVTENNFEMKDFFRKLASELEFLIAGEYNHLLFVISVLQRPVSIKVKTKEGSNVSSDGTVSGVIKGESTNGVLSSYFEVNSLHSPAMRNSSSLASFLKKSFISKLFSVTA